VLLSGYKHPPDSCSVKENRNLVPKSEQVLIFAAIHLAVQAGELTGGSTGQPAGGDFFLAAVSGLVSTLIVHQIKKHVERRDSATRVAF